jgi:DNA-binding response OmpR family regulator
MRRYESDVFDRTIDVLILRCDERSSKIPSAPRFIRTERGSGYIFTVPEETGRPP